MAAINRKEIRQRVHTRVRKKVSGTTERPRLTVFFSNKNVYAQIINDETSRTLCSASTKEKGATGKANVASATKVGELIAGALNSTDDTKFPKGNAPTFFCQNPYFADGTI